MGKSREKRQRANSTRSGSEKSQVSYKSEEEVIDSQYFNEDQEIGIKGKKRSRSRSKSEISESQNDSNDEQIAVNDAPEEDGLEGSVEEESEIEADDSHEEGEAKDKEISAASQRYERTVIVVMEEACLEPVKTSKGNFELLNCDDHLYLHKKLNKDPTGSRPDILHQCLLMLLDSPLNKTGHLKVYVRSKENVLFELSPSVRIPRTFKRFSGLMVQLLHKMRIKAVNGNTTLMKVIKNPITKHLPPNALIFGTSVTGELVDTHDFVNTLRDDRPYVFVFGAFAKGHLEPEYADKMLSFSQFPLSAACAINRLMNAFERKWDIL